MLTISLTSWFYLYNSKCWLQYFAKLVHLDTQHHFLKHHSDTTKCLHFIVPIFYFCFTIVFGLNFFFVRGAPLILKRSVECLKLFCLEGKYQICVRKIRMISVINILRSGGLARILIFYSLLVSITHFGSIRHFKNKLCGHSIMYCIFFVPKCVIETS